MSGNMSFNNFGSAVASASSASGPGPAASMTNGNGNVNLGRRSGTYGQFNSSLLSGGRSSLSFSSEMDSPSTSIIEGGGRGRVNENYQDKDVWGTRIILSSLEEIAFSETNYPKITPELKHAFQKFLLAVHAASSNVNPFVEQEKMSNSFVTNSPDHTSYFEDPASSSRRNGSGLEIPREVLEILENVPTETRIVLRSLISSYVRSIAMKIIKTWKPILETTGIELPLATLPEASKRKPAAAPSSLGDYDLEGCLELILDQMRSNQKESQELDLKIRDQLKKRDEELWKYERDIKIMNKINLEILKQKTAMEDPEFVGSYMDIMELESKVIEEQLRLEQLKIEAEGNSEEEQKEREQLYNKVKALYDQMEFETREMEEKIEKYKSLGPEYLQILEEFKSVEENITTKEWVKEQLQNGPRDDSLLKDDSFDF